MWLGCAKFKSECTNISLGVNYTSKKLLYINLKKKKKIQVEPPEDKVTPPMGLNSPVKKKKSIGSIRFNSTIFIKNKIVYVSTRIYK